MDESEPAPQAQPPGFQAMPDPATYAARQWALFTHLAAFFGLVLSPIGAVIGPLVVWLIKKDEFAFVDANGRNALNWNITMQLIAMVIIAPALALFWTSTNRGGPGAALEQLGPLMIAGSLAAVVIVVEYVFAVIGAVKANDGHVYEYPFAIRFFKPAAQ